MCKFLHNFFLLRQSLNLLYIDDFMHLRIVSMETSFSILYVISGGVDQGNAIDVLASRCTTLVVRTPQQHH